MSTVTTRTRYPQAAARIDQLAGQPLVGQDVQLEPQSPCTAAASSGIDVVAIVDSV
jgi:hypothetical protein